MASYEVNEAGVAKAKALIDARHYVVRSRWGHDLLQYLDDRRKK